MSAKNRVVHLTDEHTHVLRGDVAMAKHLQFPPEVEEFIHQLTANAILRAIRNGTFVPPEQEVAATAEDSASEGNLLD